MPSDLKMKFQQKRKKLNALDTAVLWWHILNLFWSFLSCEYIKIAILQKSVFFILLLALILELCVILQILNVRCFTDKSVLSSSHIEEKVGSEVGNP